MSDDRLRLDEQETAKLRLIDVGGAGGLQGKWLKSAHAVMPVMFEPNAEEAAKLRGTVTERFGRALVVETGLSNVTGPQTLNITRYWGCTSLRQPNMDVLSQYRIGGAFHVMRTEPITCTRYDSLHRDGLVPAPDAIKVDVQGYEYEVLQGFGGLLQGCLGIELETHLYPLYKGQKLLHDIVDFLADFGFVLRRLDPVPSFDGDLVECDAYFTKNRQAWTQFNPVQRAKFSLICDTWDLIDYTRIDPYAPHSHIAPR